MSARGWRRGQAHALLLATLLTVTAAGCARELDEAMNLGTTLGMLDDVAAAEVATATADSAARVDVVLDDDLDAGAALAAIRAVTRETDAAGWRGWTLDVHRSPVDDDVLVVGPEFATDRGARVVVENWIRVSDALLGEVTYAAGAEDEIIEVESGGGIGHDVTEASRIGYGWTDTTWHFRADGAAYVVDGRVDDRDVELFERVQRSVASSVLPVPAAAWRLERRTTHLTLDLEVMIGGTDPRAISVDRWGVDVRPLAQAALRTTRYPGRARWLLISNVRTTDGETTRDTFASWSSHAPPVKGRDRYLRGWDAWWWELSGRAKEGTQARDQDADDPGGEAVGGP